MITKLKHIANLSGTTVKEFQGEKKYYSTGDINTEKFELVTFKNRPSRANLLVNENNILIAKMKNTNKTTIATKEMEEYIFSTGFSILSSKNINTKYLYYLLESPEFIEKKDVFSVGTTQVSINDEALKNIEINYIEDTNIQNRIAIFLDKKVLEIDNIIEKTKMTIEDYKKYKQSVITEAVTKGLDKNVEMKDCGIDYLGKIPKSWNIASIGKIFDFISGYAYKSEKFVSETNYQVLRLGNIKNDNLILNDKQVFINEDYANESQKVRVLKNDILFTMTGTRKKKDYFYTLIIKEENLLGKNLYINQRVGCFRTNNKNINMKYYNYLLKFQPIVDYIFLFETGTANQGNIGIETINTTMLTIPPIETQNEIVEYLDNKCIEINNLISSKERMIDELQQYKKSLIYEYVTGKKEVI